jgi:hypothetical protein
MLYGQLLARAAWDAVPFYAFAFGVYLFVAPLWMWTNLAISSFVMLYAFYMVARAWWLVRYLRLLGFHWEDAGPTFAVREANLKTRSAAIRHVLWSYFLGNIGLVVRCAAQVLTISLFEGLRSAMGVDVATHSTLGPLLVPIGIAVAGLWLATYGLAGRRALLIYYRTHRTLHSCRPLYDSIHAIHHRAILPTPLDSGTISPAEFLVTEMAFPAGTLVPNWFFTIHQILFALLGHWRGHDSGRTVNHHLLHHRLFNVNFGITPTTDARFGTLHPQQPATKSHASAPGTP